MQVRKQFPFGEFEPRWQKYWVENATFRAADPGEPGSEKPKYFVMDMFPYPSGDGLHVGHIEGYTATDIIARFKRMRGFNVLHPLGWDAFGLPAEQHALKTGIHPSITVKENINTFRRQAQAMGFSYDWSREFATTDPDYYKWTQWIFLQLYKKGLAYVTDAPVWYCPEMGTVLSNEEVINTEQGPRSERGDFPVERRFLRQWMLKITAYADRLLADLDQLDWPESLKEMQRNWIGRSEGAEIVFELNELPDERVSVFTTRQDTLFGVSFLVLAPEHPLVKKVTSTARLAAVEEYVATAVNRSELERTDLAKTKAGVFTGGCALHPVTGEKIPIWIAEYVLMSYGTGAVMGVPAHDERDYEFAQKYNLPIPHVIKPPQGTPAAGCYTGDGTVMASQFLDGLTIPAAKKKMIEWLVQNKKGSARVQYKLRDWLFSRQRYWGEPFPIVWNGDKHQPVAESELPVLLPDLEDYKPSKEGLAPLSKAKEWVNLPGGLKRETNTMPNWAGSCWYYLRYCDNKNDMAFVDPKKEKYWMGPKGVDLYVGGAEHAVLHLLYSRFWHKVLYDLGLVSTNEPFHKLVNQGMILGEDHQKMSKSLGNVISPESVIKEYGADSVRLFEMFMGPLEQTKPWSTTGVEGVYRFLGRYWRLVMEETQEGEWALSSKIADVEPSPAIKRRLHETIKKVTEDCEALAFNTAISALMILVNDLTKEEKRPRSTLKTLTLLLAPFAPHIAEEVWSKLGETKTLAWEKWPEYDPTLLVADEVEYAIQVNGKVRGRMIISANAPEAAVVAKAKLVPELQEWIAGKTINKAIHVPGKLVNFVVS
jgi:leucyl-tRNA synthetase